VFERAQLSVHVPQTMPQRIDVLLEGREVFRRARRREGLEMSFHAFGIRSRKLGETPGRPGVALGEFRRRHRGVRVAVLRTAPRPVARGQFPIVLIVLGMRRFDTSPTACRVCFNNGST